MKGLGFRVRGFIKVVVGASDSVGLLSRVSTI